MKNSARDLLASYIDALYPIIYINHFDFKVIDEIISDISNDKKVIEYNNGLGIVNFTNKSFIKECDLFEFLKLVKDDGYETDTIIVLKDVHSQLEQPEVVSLLKYIAERNLYNESYNASIFIVSSKLCIPEELEDLITVFDVPLPSITVIKDIMYEFIKDLEIDVDENVISEIALSFKGLNEFQIKQLLNLAYQDGGCIDYEDKQLILRQKEQLIKKAGLLEMIQVHETINDIGGLEIMKKWLYRKEKIFNQLDKAMKFGVDIPKGIMIVGMPGCGKSLAAKATSKLFEIPLVRLDVGRLLGKYIGESEENMRKALQLSEAISPCVLWIDEIEKAFSGVGGAGGGSDVTTRLFGQFLTWMQEKENTVFIVATANDISKIPPEFLRKGRFDELFYVDFPNAEERKKILEIHLKKRNKLNNDIDLMTVVKKTEGYNGADLEAIVTDAIENCFIEGKMQLETQDLLHSQESIKSISTTLKDRIETIKKAVTGMDLKPASAKTDQIEVATNKSVKENKNNEIPISTSATSISEVLGKNWWKKPDAKFVPEKVVEEKIPAEKIAPVVDERTVVSQKLDMYLMLMQKMMKE